MIRFLRAAYWLTLGNVARALFEVGCRLDDACDDTPQALDLDELRDAIDHDARRQAHMQAEFQASSGNARASHEG